MNNPGLLDRALDMMSGDLDEMEGESLSHHELEECPDPFSCEQHSGELSGSLSKDIPKTPTENDGDDPLDNVQKNGAEPAIVTVEVRKEGLPSLNKGEELEGKEVNKDTGSNESGLSSEEAEVLKKLLK